MAPASKLEEKAFEGSIDSPPPLLLLLFFSIAESGFISNPSQKRQVLNLMVPSQESLHLEPFLCKELGCSSVECELVRI